MSKKAQYTRWEVPCGGEVEMCQLERWWGNVEFLEWLVAEQGWLLSKPHGSHTVATALCRGLLSISTTNPNPDRRKPSLTPPFPSSNSHSSTMLPLADAPPTTTTTTTSIIISNFTDEPHLHSDVRPTKLIPLRTLGEIRAAIQTSIRGFFFTRLYTQPLAYLC